MRRDLSKCQINRPKLINKISQRETAPNLKDIQQKPIFSKKKDLLCSKNENKKCLTLLVNRYLFINKVTKKLKEYGVIYKERREKFNFSSLKMLNDKAIFVKFEKKIIFTKKKYFQFFMVFDDLRKNVSMKLKFKNYFKISSSFYKKWNFMIFLFSVFLIILIPLDIGFYEEYSGRLRSINYYFYLFLLFLFFLDFLIKSFKLNKKNSEGNSDKFFAKYYFIDFLVVSCLIISLSSHRFFLGEWNRFLNLLICLKVHHLIKTILSFQQKLIQNYKQRFLCDSLNILLITAFSSHYCSCLWYFICNLEKESAYTWLKANNIDDFFFVQKYIYCLNFVVEILTFQSHYLIGPQNFLEYFAIFIIRLYSIFLLFLFLYQCFVLFIDLSQKNKRFKDNILIMNQFFDKKEISDHLKLMTEEYLLDKSLDNSISNSFEDQKNFLKSLPKSLQKEISFQKNHIFIKRIQLLTKNFSKEAVESTSFYFEELLFHPDEKIFEKFDNENSLYFIKKGAVSFSFYNYENRIKTHLFVKHADEVFGKLEFLTNNQREMTAYSLCTTILLKLERKTFLELLKERKTDYFKFCSMRDEILLQQKYENLNSPCKACSELPHNETICPIIHYIPSNGLSRNLNQPENRAMREIFQRKTQKSRIYKNNMLNQSCDKEIDKNDVSMEIFEYDSKRSDISSDTHNSTQEKTKDGKERFNLDELDEIEVNESNYFPHNNCKNVCLKFNNKIRRIEKWFYSKTDEFQSYD